jgi:hypothetical protein
MMLRLLGSTGTAGYNHPLYDNMPLTLSVGIPWQLLDAASILAMGSTP